ncbi:terminase small subunit [Parasphingorhabdus sp.]|uniref:terminase small subunit n=1 Tax=Parasphingorhabdus sp. TaxID=2709688 RepID=UPI00300318A7
MKCNEGRRPHSSLGYKQSRFVEEYLIDLNAIQAAIRSGYSSSSYRAKQYPCTNEGNRAK